MIYIIFFTIAIIGIYFIYEEIYFSSEGFKKIKNSILNYTNNCNELNEHIENLKNTYARISSYDYGVSTLKDISNYNFKRREWKKHLRSHQVYNCSLTICRNAHNQPFKYLCKYFNIKTTEETLETFENVLNNFSAVESGKIILTGEKNKILSSIERKLSVLILIFNKKRMVRELGFDDIDLTDLYFPVYTFHYISAGGNSSMKLDIKLDVDNLEKFVRYLNEQVKFKNSIQGQRALMTTLLREKIKMRDNYTCRICGATIDNEKNLLLEIDHIVPLSKGGMTTEDNLQTLCWKCNRKKGSKIEL